MCGVSVFDIYFTEFDNYFTYFVPVLLYILL
jgi:hypothetical protein